MIRTAEQDAPPFPHQGAIAYIEGTGEKVQIVQRNADGTCLLKRLDRTFARRPGMLGIASGNTRLPLAQLHADQRAALTYAGKLGDSVRQSRRAPSARSRKPRRGAPVGAA